MTLKQIIQVATSYTKENEGFENKIYTCSEGFLTCGYGTTVKYASLQNLEQITNKTSKSKEELQKYVIDNQNDIFVSEELASDMLVDVMKRAVEHIYEYFYEDIDTEQDNLFILLSDMTNAPYLLASTIIKIPHQNIKT